MKKEITNKIRNKKAQTEIVGLLIIVILVIIVISIVLKFVSTKEPEQIQKDYMQDQMATSFLLSLLRTNTNCSNYVTFEVAIKDCAKERLINCEGQNVCNYLNGSIETILNNTLNKWTYYNLVISHYSLPNSNFTYSNSNSSGVYGASYYTIPMWPQRNPITIRLEILK